MDVYGTWIASPLHLKLETLEILRLHKTPRLSFWTDIGVPTQRDASTLRKMNPKCLMPINGAHQKSISVYPGTKSFYCTLQKRRTCWRISYRSTNSCFSPFQYLQVTDMCHQRVSCCTVIISYCFVYMLYIKVMIRRKKQPCPRDTQQVGWTVYRYTKKGRVVERKPLAEKQEKKSELKTGRDKIKWWASEINW